MKAFETLFDTYHEQIPAVTEVEIEKYARYHCLLAEWNTRFNLVSPASLLNAFSAHFVDSIWISDAAFETPCKRLVDLGSGAGFPGLVMAIRHRVPVHLFERTGKKRNFLGSIIKKLSIEATVFPDFSKSAVPVTMTARAVMPPGELLSYIRNRLPPNSFVVVPTTKQLKVDSVEGFSLFKTSSYVLPISNAERSLIIFKRST